MQVKQSAFYKSKSGEMMADKAPEARLEFGLQWLEVSEGSSILRATWTTDTGIVAENPHVESTTAFAWLAGGEIGKKYEVTCVVEMSDGRIDSCSFLLNICRREPSIWID